MKKSKLFFIIGLSVGLFMWLSYFIGFLPDFLIGNGMYGLFALLASVLTAPVFVLLVIWTIKGLKNDEDPKPLCFILLMAAVGFMVLMMLINSITDFAIWMSDLADNGDWYDADAKARIVFGALFNLFGALVVDAVAVGVPVVAFIVSRKENN